MMVSCMPGASIVLAMTRQQIQRTKFIDAKTSTAFGTLAVEASQAAVFGPKLWIGGILPGLGVAPLNFVSTQHLPQPLQRYRTHKLLINQILAQFRKRPDAHANQLLRWRKSHLTDLFYHIGEKLPGTGTATVIRVPRDGINASAIEAVNDLANPGRRTATALGNLSVAETALRQQNHSGMSAIDSISQLSFHTLEVAPLPRPQLPCSYLVHFWFSTCCRLLHAVVVENLSILYLVVAQALYLQIVTTGSENTKLCYWKRH